MKQLENYKICKYCLGCEKLADEKFDGVENCRGFVPGYEDWEKRFYKALKEENDDGMQAQKSRR